MPYTCCLPTCKSNYLTSIKREGTVSVYRFPEDKVERDRWLSVVTRPDLRAIFEKYETEDKKTRKKPAIFVCRKHWPQETAFFNCRGKERPIDPPSVFTPDGDSDSDSSCTQQAETVVRITKRALPSIRSVQPDELVSFLQQDVITFEEIQKKVHPMENLVSYKVNEDTICVQCLEFIHGIPKYLLFLNRDLSFKTFHLGSSCTISTLSKNKIDKCKHWSTFEEIIRFLSKLPVDNKKNVILQQHDVMGAKPVGVSLYPTDVITRAFEYFATSRVLYNKLAKDFQLPSARTLTRLTSKVSKEDEVSLLTKVFSKLKEQQRACVLMLDEVYVKKSLLYHGGSFFGKAENNPEELANTVLTLMLKCAYGGPEFVAKMLPVAKLDAQFQYSQCLALMENIININADILAVVVDGNRVNQKFFKKFKKVAGKPWLAHLQNVNKFIYLLYDYVHLLKCVRNNWLTEENGELEFEWNGEKLIAKWNVLRHLHLVESSGLTKLSRLNEQSVFPKPIERQNVSLCLRVFSYETIAALETHPEIDQEDARGTVQFLKIILGFWKIVNSKKKGEGEFFKDELRGEINHPDDIKLKILLKIADMAEKMTAPGKKRTKQLTKDTGTSLSHTCRGLVDLARSLLLSGNDYVLLGDYTTDPLEKNFSKLRQGSGGTYFITVQSVLEKTRIQHAKLCLQLGVHIEGKDGHDCGICNRNLTEKESEVFDNLTDLEDHVARDTMLSLIYIAGKIEVKAKTETEDTFLYYEKYSAYLDALNRGNLCVPSDNVVQWTTLCYIFFTECSTGEVCRSFLKKQFQEIARKYELQVTEKQCHVQANIWMNNFSIAKTPRSSKEIKLKELKLS